MICPNCGHENEWGSEFCENCGYNLSEMYGYQDPNGYMDSSGYMNQDGYGDSGDYANSGDYMNDEAAGYADQEGYAGQDAYYDYEYDENNVSTGNAAYDIFLGIVNKIKSIDWSKVKENISEITEKVKSIKKEKKGQIVKRERSIKVAEGEVDTKKTKVRKPILIICIAAIVILLFTTFAPKFLNTGFLGKEKFASIDAFYSNKRDVEINKETEVIFYAEISANYDISKNKVVVVDEFEKRVTDLNDDGEGVDEKAGDGKFSGSAKLKQKAEISLSYKAVFNGMASNPIEISFYVMPSKEELDKTDSAINEIKKFDNLDSLTKHLDKQNNLKYSVSKDKKSVVIDFDSGIKFTWKKYDDIKNKDINSLTKSGDSVDYNDLIFKMYDDIDRELNEFELAPTQTVKDVCVIRPFRSTEFLIDDFIYAGQTVSKHLNSKVECYDDNKATLGVFRKFGKYGLVLIDSHGSLDEVNGVNYIVTGETAKVSIEDLASGNATLDYNSDFSRPIYNDFRQGRIALTMTRSGNIICMVNADYFDKYYKSNSLTGTTIFLGTCYGMYNDSFANVFINKGAKIVCGFSDTVTVGYCNAILYQLVADNLLRGEQMSIAYDNAINEHGEYDSYIEKSEGLYCYTKYKGDAKFKLVSCDTSIVTGRVVSEKDNKPIPKTKILMVENKTKNEMSASTIPDGSFKLKVKKSNYTIKFSAPGYSVNGFGHVSLSPARITRFEEDIILKPSDSESIHGYVTNKKNSKPIKGAVIKFRSGTGNKEGDYVVGKNKSDLVLTSDESGFFKSEKIPNGKYTAEIKASGYKTGYKNITVGILD